MDHQQKRGRFATSLPTQVVTTAVLEETMVPDLRDGVSSEEMIDRRLVFLLGRTPASRRPS